MLRAVAPDPGLLEWLWSLEGQWWSERTFQRVRFQDGGSFGSVKPDHECGDRRPFRSCAGGWQAETFIAVSARKEYEKYGLSGIPDDWREWHDDAEGSGTA